MAPLELSELEAFIWSNILQSLRVDYLDDQLEQRKYIKTIFKEKLRNLGTTALRGTKLHTEEFEQAIGPYLFTWQEDVADYVPKLLRFASVLKSKAVIIFIDNVDQLDPDYQAQIFLLAQRITRVSGSIAIIALREESYYITSIQRAFTAYTSHRFHIASPQFRKLIGSRIEYAIKALDDTEHPAIIKLFGVSQFDSKDIAEFLSIVQNSIFGWNRRISRFIECVCFGNMRAALQMFTTFLVSGATDVYKMLLIYRRDGNYNVPFHEFLKSAMLQDRAYYKEEQSPILNIYNCSGERNASHFTSMRLLSLLLDRRGESNPEGKGYVELGRVIGLFADLFDNVLELSKAMDRLLSRQLIEANNRSQRTVSGTSHIRVTAAGWYYIRYLCDSFAYLDLVLQDTPLNDSGVEPIIRRSVYEVSNLSDRDAEKLERMKVRFDRTQLFIDYLVKEEQLEVSNYGLLRFPAPLSNVYMPRINGAFARERAHIEGRLAEGRIDELPDDKEEISVSEYEIPVEQEGDDEQQKLNL